MVVAFAEFRRLAAPKQSLIDFLRQSPLAAALAEGEFDLRRSRDEGRRIDL